MTAQFLEDFIQGYMGCALWQAPEDEKGKNLDEFSIFDFDPKSEAEIREECADFVKANEKDLDLYEQTIFAVRSGKNSGGDGGSAAEYAGHDFCLTRNGHGAGFWDRGLGALGDRLTKAAKVYGEFFIYAGDDGKVHVE